MKYIKYILLKNYVDILIKDPSKESNVNGLRGIPEEKSA